MKTIILFTSHHGTTRKLTNQLSQDLGLNDIDIIDFKSNKHIDLSPYELVIIGSSIHVGKIPPDFSKFLYKNIDMLLAKKIALFMCAMEKPEIQTEEFENNFPKELRYHSLANGLFGGEYLFEKMNFFEKIIIKKITGFDKSKSEINYDAYYDFVEKLKLSA